MTSNPILLERMCDSLHLDKSLWGESSRVGAHKFKTLFRDMGLADILCPTIDEIQVLEEKSAAPVEITARRRPPVPIEPLICVVQRNEPISEHQPSSTSTRSES